MKVVDIANQIYLENGQPSDTSIAAIAFWLRSNVGKLNSLVYENFWIDPQSLEIVNDKTPLWSGQATGSKSGTYEINHLASNILISMYKVYRVELDIRNVMAGIKTDTVLEAQDQEFRIKKLDRNTLLKTLTAFKKDTIKEMMDMVHTYRSYYAVPGQVAGDDTEIGYYNGDSMQIFSRSFPNGYYSGN